MNKEVMEYLEMYLKKFDEGFPTYQLARGKSDKEIVELIKKCLNAGKTVYEIGLLSDDDDERVYY